MGRRSPTLRMKGALRSRNVRRRAAVRKKRILRTRVRHHNHRRYAGVRGPLAAKKRLRRRKVKPATASAKRRHYKARPKPLQGQGLPPLPLSTYMSMF